MSNGNENKWLTGWKAIARYLDVSIDTARRYHADLHLPVYSVGKGRFIRAHRDEVDDWIRGKQGSHHGKSYLGIARIPLRNVMQKTAQANT